MLNRAPVSAPAPVKVEPTSLLQLVAGEFAPRIAQLWPAPHAEFLTAPVARRHLLCLALALGRDLAVLADVIRLRRLAQAVRTAAPGAPAGLTRAVGRLGEVAWCAEGYRRLLALLGDRAAGKVLRHAEAIDPQMVRRLAVMPQPMACAAHLAAELSDDGVSALLEAYEALRFRSGKAAAEEAAARWSQARTPTALAEAVRYELSPEPAAPPHPGTARLRPFTSKAGMREASRRYRNCLVDRMSYAATGWSAYYEWLGRPGAIVEISRDHVFGWRLEEARLADNAPVPEALREEIVSELALMGVHVGRSGWELDRLVGLIRASDYRPRPVGQAIAEAFGAA